MSKARRRLTHVSTDEALRLEALYLDSQTDASVRFKKKRGGPSKNEEAYARHLEALLISGLILDYRAQPEPIELAHRCTYQPDFWVMPRDGVPEYIEVKGAKRGRPYYRDDGARVKVKVAARALHPSIALVVAWPKKGGGWCREVVPS